MPAQSKFGMLQEWALPDSGTSLLSYIGLVGYYQKWIPYFELRIKPLRALQRRYHRSALPFMAWTPDLICIFNELRSSILSSPVLRRFDPERPCFLKTDFCALGMGWILLQPDTDAQSEKALKHLQQTGECLFDLSQDGPRFCPIGMGSRACSEGERSLHSATGESAAGRFGIAQNKNYLWGSHFYWICDCSGAQKLIDYDGPMMCMKRWSQELLAYQFTGLHWNANRMTDVDALSGRMHHLVSEYVQYASALRVQDVGQRPMAYNSKKFKDFPTGIKSKTTAKSVVLTSANVAAILSKHKHSNLLISSASTATARPTTSLTTCPPNFVTAIETKLPIANLPETSSDHSSMTIQSLSNLVIVWLSIDNCLGTNVMRNYPSTAPLSTHVHYCFTQRNDTSVKSATSQIFNALHPDTQVCYINMHTFAEAARLPSTSNFQPSLPADLSSSLAQGNINGVDVTFTETSNTFLLDWCKAVCRLISKLSEVHLGLLVGHIWIPTRHCITPLLRRIEPTLRESLGTGWSIQHASLNSAEHGDAVSGLRELFFLCRIDPNLASTICPLRLDNQFCQRTNLGYSPTLQSSTGDSLPQGSIIIPQSAFTVETSTAHNKHYPLPLAAIRHPLQRNPSPDSCNFVLDPAYPAAEPCTSSAENGIFGRRFGIPFTVPSSSFWYGRPPTDWEICSIYGMPQNAIPNVLSLRLNEQLDDTVSCCTPICLQEAALQLSFDNIFLPEIDFADVDYSTTSSCLLVSKSPSQDSWELGYSSDTSCRVIRDALRRNPGHSWSKEELKQVNPGFHLDLVQHRIIFKDNRLMRLRVVCPKSKFIAVIIPPENLRRFIFDTYHSSPIGGHMGLYKTLEQLRLRFFWPKMRQDVVNWLKTCAQCAADDVWRNSRNELQFSWPVTVPFYILHLDVWFPGATTDEQGHSGLLHAMCDLTQFVIVAEFKELNSETLATLFMERFVLQFGICAIVVVDAGSEFLGLFEQMCDALGIILWKLSRGNHKGNSSERFHRVLNKTETIQGAELDSLTCFVKIAKTIAYGWNSSPIDNTSIPRSLAAIGRILRFPFDVKLHPLPTSLNDQANNSLLDYLREVAAEGPLAQTVVQILVEERRAYHQMRHNQGKDLTPRFKVGDVVKAHVQVQSNADAGRVGKLSYQARGPYVVTKDLGFSSFEVQVYNQPNSQRRKYKAEQLYPLHPDLYPAEAFDSMDQRYLNYSHPPAVSPLKQAMRVEVYNSTWFDKKPVTSSPSGNEGGGSTSTIDDLAFQPHSALPSTEEWEHNDDKASTPPEQEQAVPLHSLPSLSSLFQEISVSDDKLFFVKFTPANTLRPRWYLVQVDLDSSFAADCQPQATGNYYCVFHYRHPADKERSDELSRWWPEWYAFKRNPTDNDEIIYGRRMLIRPNVNPDPAKYIQWATVLNLFDDQTNLLGPFNFKAVTRFGNTRNLVPADVWRSLVTLCPRYGLTPPSLGNAPSSLLPQRQKQTRKTRRSK